MVPRSGPSPNFAIGLAIGTTSPPLARRLANIGVDAVRGIEILSYLLICLVGARLLWIKGKAFRTGLQRMTLQVRPGEARCRWSITARTSIAAHRVRRGEIAKLTCGHILIEDLA